MWRKHHLKVDKCMVSRVVLRWVSASITEECYYELLFTSQTGAWRVGLIHSFE